MRSITFGIATVLALGNASLAGSICTLSPDEASKSPRCLQWHLGCKGLDAMTPNRVPEKLAIIQGAFADAERQCEHFSYQEARAALEAKLKLAGMPAKPSEPAADR